MMGDPWWAFVLAIIAGSGCGGYIGWQLSKVFPRQPRFDNDDIGRWLADLDRRRTEEETTQP